MKRNAGPWEHLPQPFEPGQVVPSNRNGHEFHFTFVSGGETYHWRYCDIATEAAALLEMRRFCAQHGNTELAQYLDESLHPRHPARNWRVALPPLAELIPATWGGGHRYRKPGGRDERD